MLDVPSLLAASPRARSIHSVPSRSVSVLVLSLHLAPANSDVRLTSSDLMLPFTVTISVTDGELSIAVESRDVNPCLGSSQVEELQRFDLCPLVADDSRHRPDIP